MGVDVPVLKSSHENSTDVRDLDITSLFTGRIYHAQDKYEMDSLFISTSLRRFTTSLEAHNEIVCDG